METGEKMVLIELKQVAYQTDKQTILQDVSFALAAGDYVTLTGPSGSGKSTTLKLITGLISPTSEASWARINTQVS